MSRYVKDTNGNWNLSAGIPQIDNELDSTSENPVQNKAIVEGISPMLNVLGAKNLLQNNATSQTINGITFIVNTDPTSEEYGAVTVSGTATANAILNVNAGQTIQKCDRYILSGCPSGGGMSTYCLSWPLHGIDMGDSVEVTYDSSTHSQTIQIVIWSGTAITTPITFYPMIRPASVADDTYVPYAMTNRELTKVAGLNNIGNITLPEATSKGFGGVTCNYIKQGNLAQIEVNISASSVSLNQYDVIEWTLPSILVPKVPRSRTIQDVVGHSYVIRILTTGKLQLQTFQTLTATSATFCSETYFTQ